MASRRAVQLPDSATEPPLSISLVDIDQTVRCIPIWEPSCPQMVVASSGHNGNRLAGERQRDYFAIRNAVNVIRNNLGD